MSLLLKDVKIKKKYACVNLNVRPESQPGVRDNFYAMWLPGRPRIRDWAQNWLTLNKLGSGPRNQRPQTSSGGIEKLAGFCLTGVLYKSADGTDEASMACQQTKIIYSCSVPRTRGGFPEEVLESIDWSWGRLEQLCCLVDVLGCGKHKCIHE